MRGWLGVVSQSHVQRGVSEGFAQLCHGKAEPLRRMRRGDWLVYYSPSVQMGGTPLRAFTAIGTVLDEDVFPHDMGGGFVPFRRRVRYLHVNEVPLTAIKHRLLLCSKPHWSILLRRGHLLLEPPDLLTIAQAMGVDQNAIQQMGVSS